VALGKSTVSLSALLARIKHTPLLHRENPIFVFQSTVAFAARAAAQIVVKKVSQALRANDR
jgi:hypothetical protein